MPVDSPILTRETTERLSRRASRCITHRLYKRLRTTVGMRPPHGQ